MGRNGAAMQANCPGNTGLEWPSGMSHGRLRWPSPASPSLWPRAAWEGRTWGLAALCSWGRPFTADSPAAASQHFSVPSSAGPFSAAPSVFRSIPQYAGVPRDTCLVSAAFALGPGCLHGYDGQGPLVPGQLCGTSLLLLLGAWCHHGCCGPCWALPCSSRSTVPPAGHHLK